MRRVAPPILTLLTLSLALSCSQKEKTPGKEAPDLTPYKGLVINEIAAHDEVADAQSWVEIVNTSAADISLKGLQLYITDEYFTDQSIWKAADDALLAAGERLVLSTADESLVTGISSAAQFVLRLGVEEGVVDEFDRSKAFENPAAAYPRGSYQRVPDGGDSWKSLTYNTLGGENKVFSLDDYHRNAVWAWSSHVPDMMDNDAAKLKKMKELGYDHILLNFVAFEPANAKRTTAFLEKCEELGINVHAWMQCFYKGGWVSPVDDENKCYREDLYADIREHARTYIENFGVKGLHLDYIRFGGTASRHVVSAEVNAIGAVNRCCRELREITDSYDEGLVISAALMPEKNSEQYYGQSPSGMGQYVHILMPMAYRYSYRWNDEGCKDIVNWFADKGTPAEVWAGITTYTGNDDAGVKGMTAEALRKDIDIFMDSRAKGLVLFRYGLGEFADVTDLNQ